MNSSNTPAFMKDNPATRLANYFASLNAAEGKPAGRGAGQIARMDHVISTSSVRSLAPEADVYVPPPLSADEVNEANETARNLGLGETDPDYDPAVEAVVNAVTPPPLPAEVINTLGRQAPSAVAPIPVPSAGIPHTETDGYYLHSPRTGHVAEDIPHRGSTSRIPDFSRVQLIDLERGVCVVDNSEYPMDPADLPWFKKYCVDSVVRHVTDSIAQAYAQMGIYTPVKEAHDAGTDEDVPIVPSREELAGVQAGSTEERGTSGTVPDMHEPGEEQVASVELRAGAGDGSHIESHSTGDSAESTE